MAMAAVQHPTTGLRSGGGGGGGGGGAASPTVVKKKLLQNGWQEALITEYFQKGSDAAGIYIPNLLNGWLDQEQEQEELLNDRTLSNPVMIPPPSPSPNASSPSPRLKSKPTHNGFTQTATKPASRVPPMNSPITPSAAQAAEPKKQRVCLLSLDGGGIRGIISAKVLVYLEKLLQEKSRDPTVRIVDFFDCVAGTNVGAMIGAMLFTEDSEAPSRPLFSAQEALTFLCDNGSDMYKRNARSKTTRTPSLPLPRESPSLPPPPRSRPRKKGFLQKLFACGSDPEPEATTIRTPEPQTRKPEVPEEPDDNFWIVKQEPEPDPSSPLLSVDSLQSVLRKAFGARTLRDTLKPVLFTSYDLTLCTPLVFTRAGAVYSPEWNFQLYDVLRAGMATPGLFPPATVTAADGSKRTAVDAGMVLNCPAVNAVAHVCWNIWEYPVVVDASDVLVLSLGTGVCEKRRFGFNVSEWGPSQWARPMAEIAVENASTMADQMLGMGYAIGMAPGSRENYLRIQATLPNSIDMDAANNVNIDTLTRIADDLLQQRAVQQTGLGGPTTLKETYAQRLDWFADRLVQERQARTSKPVPPCSFMGN